MKITEKPAISIDRNPFNQTVTTNLGFNKLFYEMTQEEFEDAELPDGTYGLKADEYTRKMVKFESWEDPEDCKYISFDMKDGYILNVHDIEKEIYKSLLNYIEIVRPVKAIRDKSGLTQKEFAERYHIPERTLSNWEVPEGSANYRECPEYVIELLEKVIRYEYEEK